MDELVAAHEEDAEKARVTVRIDPGKYQDLVDLAVRLGKSRSGLAGGLLEAAIDQAIWTLDTLPKVEGVTVEPDGSVSVEVAS
ncbi:MAG: hypothetical protein M3Y74_17985 [Chloroflexota bacterium]|nr:hypothetical protein [Chloroflexota bacterium]